jgi:hypothetical protein
MAPSPVQIQFFILALIFTAFAKIDPTAFEAASIAYGIVTTHPSR